MKPDWYYRIAVHCMVATFCRNPWQHVRTGIRDYVRDLRNLRQALDEQIADMEASIAHAESQQ